MRILDLFRAEDSVALMCMMGIQPGFAQGECGVLGRIGMEYMGRAHEDFSRYTVRIVLGVVFISKITFLRVVGLVDMGKHGRRLMLMTTETSTGTGGRIQTQAQEDNTGQTLIIRMGQLKNAVNVIKSLASKGHVVDLPYRWRNYVGKQRLYKRPRRLAPFTTKVEMLAAPGYLGEALEFAEKMPMEPSVDVWETLKNLSWVHGDLELGDRCAELVEQLDATRLNKQSRAGLMVEMGYVPLLRCVLRDFDPEAEEEDLLAHTERLAFANALLISPARSPIRVTETLRVCVDCHSAINLMSKTVGREIY
ncbi:PREDICTED: pentatricopeptide repeat-containing protein At2g27610-like [Tarenaya hassleriana]|uniref:pentatricopeptide repeat-containing protein At2g27610-like n=1 Tax=Tarenaya hassleriana TaxID=28532 RepID=UPI00053CA4C8|nr:PREDICTED: pentatricopeptide repeat-containing protein At2g27610-like [Tarenaya hassleriana]